MHKFWAGLVYFGIVFGAGFALGAIRVPFLVPRIGVRYAELLEMPFMLAAVLLSARYIVRHYRLPPVALVRLGVGFIALALLVTAEIVLNLLVMEQSLSEYVTSRDPVSGVAYLVMLCLFALMPSFVRNVQQPGRA